VVGAVLVVVALVVGLVALVAWAPADEAEPDPADFADHAFPAVAWTGDRLLVYGGGDDSPGRYSNAAALIDPVTAEQEMLPSPPFDGALAVASLAADDEHALVLGWLCSDPQPGVESCAPATVTAARLDLGSHDWSPVEVPDELAHARIFDVVQGVTTDGRAVLRFTNTATPYWTYDLADDEWKHLPGPGLVARGTCLAGDRFVANVRTPEGERALAVLDLTGDGTWEQSAATDPSFVGGPRLRDELSCTDDTALIHNLFGEHALRHSLDPDELDEPWREPQPAPGSGSYVGSISTGEALVFLNLSPDGMPAGGAALSYDPAGDRWKELSGAPLSSASLVWSGDAIVGFAQDADLGQAVPPKRLVRYVPGS
jgi:hypothetical protein